VRLAFAVAVHVDPDVLLVDEVLAVGDEPFQRKCLERIKAFQRDGRTIILVTHGLDTVRQLCDRVIMLEKGDVIVDGTPIDALRAFRDRYSMQLEGAPDESGTRVLEILKTIITDGEGRPQDRFAPGDPLGFEMEVAAHQPIDDWVAGVAIFNHLDQLIYGTNTNLQGFQLPPISDRKRIRFNFGDIPMVEGQYFVTVALHNRDETAEYHRLERHSSFRVFSAPTEHGVLHMNSTFEVLDA
jgi:ABC-2 type transport system ATP-binding protein